MNRLRRVWRGAASVLFPWPRKDEREQAIAAAARGKEQARHRAAHAAQVRTQIEQLAASNHFAAAIADQIIARHQRGE